MFTSGESHLNQKSIFIDDGLCSQSKKTLIKQKNQQLVANITDHIYCCDIYLVKLDTIRPIYLISIKLPKALPVDLKSDIAKSATSCYQSETFLVGAIMQDKLELVFGKDRFAIPTRMYVLADRTPIATQKSSSLAKPASVLYVLTHRIVRTKSPVRE